MAYTFREQITRQNRIRRLKRNISNRLKRLKDSFGGGNVESKIIKRFEKQFKKAITDEKGNVIRITKNTPTAVLREIEKNLERLDIKGATHSKDFALYADTIAMCTEYGVDIDEAFALYDTLVEEGALLANYKYEVVSKIVEYKRDGLTDQEIADNIHNILEQLSGGNNNWKDAVENVERYYDYTSL